MQRVMMRILLLCGMVLASGLSGCLGSEPSLDPLGFSEIDQDADVLTIYSGVQPALLAPLLEDFTSSTNIEIKIQYDGGAQGTISRLGDDFSVEDNIADVVLMSSGVGLEAARIRGPGWFQPYNLLGRNGWGAGY